VTHEHGDHIAGMRVIHKRLGLGVYVNAGTSECLDRSPDTRGMPWQIFSNGSSFAVGDLQILPFSVPHDAYDPVGFIVSCGAMRVGVVTDMGIVTELIRQRLSGCQVLVVEANHDERMVADAKRPWYLKQRILGRQGHLSNRNAAELVAAVGGPHLRAVFLAHLSAECNRPELAREVVEEKLRECNMTHVRVVMTYPDKVSEVWRE
jgi:phosphoribosyl 1,2-cyclic phosphodiesterase